MYKESGSQAESIDYHLGGCQNCMGTMEKKMETTILGLYIYIPYQSLFGHPKYQVLYYNRDPKRDHNFDNHPFLYYKDVSVLDLALRALLQALSCRGGCGNHSRQQNSSRNLLK